MTEELLSSNYVESNSFKKFVSISFRGNDAVMTRGTFANIRLVNKFIGKSGPVTIHIPSGQEVNHINFQNY